MKKKPLVSIIINCHNGEKYLDKTIKSVLGQNYKHWEIIFFDNNSTDKSSFIVKKYKDRRIKYFKSQKKHSLYKARNLATSKSFFKRSDH
jgi:glycosyltransferase involved in cell wall biosynthesis